MSSQAKKRAKQGRGDRNEEFSQVVHYTRSVGFGATTVGLRSTHLGDLSRVELPVNTIFFKYMHLRCKEVMPKLNRARIDYMPGGAALDALALVQAICPKLRTQALLYRLLITAVSALHHATQHRPWQPPGMWGNDRDR